MIDLLLDLLTHDLTLSSGDLQFVTEDAAIRQNLKQLLLFFNGEWFLDTTQGFPYFQLVFLKNPNLDLIQATMVQYISDADGITEVVDFLYDYDNVQRTISITTDARSTNGQILTVTAAPGV